MTVFLRGIITDERLPLVVELYHAHPPTATLVL